MSEPALILNVDDNAPARYTKHRILTHAGFVVYDAATGRECLDLFDKHSPDLVLLDVNLPDINGIEVCRKLKVPPYGASVIVLQISATATTATHATAALNSGADAYLAEPVDQEVLVATVKALLRLRAAERALAAANERLEAVNRDLQTSNESLAQFAFVASHDLQEPLRTVVTFSGLLERSIGPGLEGEQKQYLQYIIQSARRMRALIGDLLHYSQIGQSRSATSSLDMNEVFTWATETLRETIAESGALVTAGHLPVVLGDEGQLRHVVQNLIGNAIKYRHPDRTPEIHVSSVRNGTTWVIRIADNGIGIDSQYWDQIFAPFKRLHGQEIPGTGIGLAVCRRVIEAHGGRIWVESTLGEGTAFSFTLPAAP